MVNFKKARELLFMTEAEVKKAEGDAKSALGRKNKFITVGTAQFDPAFFLTCVRKARRDNFKPFFPGTFRDRKSKVFMVLP